MTSFKSLSDHDLLHMHKNNAAKNHTAVIQAYEVLVPLAFMITPRLCPYYVAKWVQYCLQYRVASEHIPGERWQLYYTWICSLDLIIILAGVYSSAAYVSFAAMFCQELNENTRIGYRIGQLGLKLLHQSSCITEIPTVYNYYYGYVGIWIEPIQAVIDMHHKAFGIGYQVGNVSVAALHKMFYVIRKFYVGSNLVQLKEELEHELMSEEYHCSFPVLGKKLKYLYVTITRLIGDEEPSIMPHPEPELGVFDDEQSFIAREMVYLTYRGHFERVNYLAKRWNAFSAGNQWGLNLRSVYVCFYSCLSMLHTGRSLAGRKKKPKKSEIDDLFSVVKKAAQHSSWNFKNKVALINAERLSSSEMNPEAESE